MPTMSRPGVTVTLPPPVAQTGVVMRPLLTVPLGRVGAVKPLALSAT
jgi:hypothetical protein